MKIKLPIWLCLVISLALVIFGLSFGTVRGFHDEKAQVTACLESENGLLDVLSYRGADGLNLCVVAKRHLAADDENVTALENASRTLQSAQASLEQKKAADTALESAASAVGRELRGLDSFQQSQRDQKYLDMLTNDMKNLSGSAAADTYNQAAESFNAQLDTPVIGTVARWLGVKPCPLYQ